MPSAEQVDSKRPRCLGANFTSVTEVRESTNEVLLTQTDWFPSTSELLTVEKKIKSN